MKKIFYTHFIYVYVGNYEMDNPIFYYINLENYCIVLNKFIKTLYNSIGSVRVYKMWGRALNPAQAS